MDHDQLPHDPGDEPTEATTPGSGPAEDPTRVGHAGPSEDPTRVGHAGPSEDATTVGAPTTGTQPGSARRSATAAVQVRALVLWILGLGITMGLAGVLAWASLLLGIFGLAGIALAVALTLVAVAILVWRRGMLPMAVLAAALALPATVVALGEVRFDRSIGTLTVAPATKADVQPTAYRRGSGTVFLDLRKTVFEPGSTTRIKAIADNGPVIVALPRDQCLNTSVRYRTDPHDDNYAVIAAGESVRLAGLDGGTAYSSSASPGVLSRWGRQLENDRYDGSSGLPAGRYYDHYGLLAYGRGSVGIVDDATGASTWKRPSTDARAPKLELDLTSRDQIVLRDYPDFAAPLTDEFDQGDPTQVAGKSWPEYVAAPPPPGALRRAWHASVRTTANRARWVAWERRVIGFAEAQAKRAAGSCATRDELRARAYSFATQAGTVRGKDGRVDRLLGGPTTRRSSIPQPTVPTKTSKLFVEVNGLGEVRVIGINSRGSISNVAVDPEVTG